MKYISIKIFLPIFACYAFSVGHVDANEKSLSAAVQNDELLSNGNIGFLKYEEKTYLVSVGVSSRKYQTPSDTIKSIKNSQLIAQTNLSNFINDVQIHTDEFLDKELKVLTETGKEISNKKYIRIIKERGEGFLKNLINIGRWESQDGDYFFYAIGILLDEK